MTQHWRKAGRRLLLPLVACSVALQACVMNRASGRTEFSLLSRDAEMQLGKENDQQMLAQFGIYDGRSLDEYIAKVGAKVAAHSDDPSLSWHFRVLDTPVVNAFALPGGYVYVSRGLIAYMENEAQLATVLGHEMGHVCARHTARRITREQLTSLGLGLGAILFQGVRPYMGILQAGTQLLFLNFSRDDERQADELGVQYAMRTGYDAAQAADVFHALDRIEQAQQKGLPLPTWASTHPAPAERRTKIVQLAQAYRNEHPGKYGGASDAEFLPHLDRLVFGENPRQGFVKNGAFYHPDMDFQFPVPSGWQVHNLASVVQLAPPGTSPNAVITVIGGTGVTPEQAVDQFIAKNHPRVMAREATKVNGMPAIALASQVTMTGAQGSQQIAVLSYFIKRGDRLFVFHGQSTPGAFQVNADTFERVFKGFGPIQDKTVLAVEPQRIRTFPAPKTDQFQDLVKPKSGVTEQELAIVNQREPNERVLRGTLLKEIR